MSINERIKTIIDTLENKSRSGFARRVGISPAQTSNIIREKGKVGDKVLSRIATAYPQISEVWLKVEEGDMFKPDVPESEKISLPPIPFERKKRKKRGVEPEAPIPAVVRPLNDPPVKKTLSPEAEINQGILNKVLQHSKIPNLTLLATKLNVNPKILNSVYNGKVAIGRKLAFAIKSKFPEIAVELGGKAKPEKPEKLEKPEEEKVKKTRTRRKANVIAEVNVQNPEIQEVVVKRPEEKFVKEKESSLLDTFILGQKELIINNTKLVEANQKLVDTLLTLLKK
ncbi:MAG: helix-turn-helix domain-containing protein [Bacteroidales bacterium]|jgi:plasmid maintenance system antidote protein VapI|nr:helix-turn-helix domain-containing protein [Bacteroidales bacterium]